MAMETYNTRREKFIRLCIDILKISAYNAKALWEIANQDEYKGSSIPDYRKLSYEKLGVIASNMAVYLHQNIKLYDQDALAHKIQSLLIVNIDKECQLIEVADLKPADNI